MIPNLDDDPRPVLEHYPALARPVPGSRLEPLGNAGGGSGARLWRYDSGRGPLVARAWPPDGPGRAPLEQVQRWLGAAEALGFVPVPLAARDGRTLIEHGGRLWEVAPWLPGRPASALPRSTDLLRAVFAALAAFHQAERADHRRGPSPALRARLDEVEELLRGGFDALEHALDRAEADPSAASARSWLSLARREAPRVRATLRAAAAIEVSLQPCLRDARPEHFLIDNDRVTGLVDFGAMGMESIAGDLARLLAEWVGDDRAGRRTALDAHAALQPLEAAEAPLIEVFEVSAALLGAGHWVRWHFVARKPFDDPMAVERGITKSLARLAHHAEGS